MRRVRAWSGLLALVALAAPTGAAAITPLPAAVLNSHATTDSDEDYSPQVATDGNGNWVAIWYSEHDLGGTLGTDGDILVSRSSDNGATWTSAAPLHSHFENDSGSDVHFALTPTQTAGSWLVVWRSNDDLDDLGPSIGTDNDVLASRSTDNGATWSAPEPVNNDAGSDTGGDGWGINMATDGAGTVVVTWSSGKNVGGTIGTDQDIIFTRSTDNGANWSDLAELNTNADSDSGADQVYAPVATDGAGNWVAAWTSTEDLESTGDDDFDIFVARSSDGGASWTSPEYLHADFKTDGRSEQFFGSLTTDGAGTWVVVWMSQSHWGYPIDTDSERRQLDPPLPPQLRLGRRHPQG
jgi:Neuraminidase (sialidase)